MAKKVLVVDDEKLIVKGIRFSLEQDGMEVDCAYDGQEALDKAMATPYDMILLDVMLPKMDGFAELIQRLKTCDADYVFTNYYEVNDVTGELNPVTFPEIRKEEQMPFEMIANETRISMHALVLKTSILKENQIRLDEHSFYVDVEYILYPIPYVKNVIYFDIFVYMYRLAQVNQSVSMLGYQKHMQNHIDVIFHVLDYINAYKEKADYDKLKELYMARRIAEMVHGQVDVFISFGSGDKVIQKKFKEFDAEVKEKNAYVYEKSGEFSGMLRLLRKFGFRFYSLIVRLSKVRNG